VILSGTLIEMAVHRLSGSAFGFTDYFGTGCAGVKALETDPDNPSISRMSLSTAGFVPGRLGRLRNAPQSTAGYSGCVMGYSLS
jgi:hypothetical protein